MHCFFTAGRKRNWRASQGWLSYYFDDEALNIMLENIVFMQAIEPSRWFFVTLLSHRAHTNTYILINLGSRAMWGKYFMSEFVISPAASCLH